MTILAEVLVADDEPDIRQLLVETLFDAGYDALEAEDGGAALRKACLEQKDNLINFEVEADSGIHVMPISQAKA